MKLHERLAELRNRHGFTQKRVAGYLGISRGAYANYEVGTREPDAKALARLAELYEVTTDYLISGYTTGAGKTQNLPLLLKKLGKTDDEIKEIMSDPSNPKIIPYNREIEPDALGTGPNENPLGIELTPDQVELLREMREDPNVLGMFKDFANSTEEERKMLLDIWATIRKNRKTD